MGISDVITILGLILAVASIIEDKERRLTMLKFGKADAVLCVIWFLSINYFILFDDFMNWDLYSASLLTPKGVSPNTWAYAISITFIAYVFYKIWFAKFPKGNTERVLSFFKTLRQEGEFTYLMKIIGKYNKDDVVKYLENGRPKEQVLEQKIFTDFISTDEFVSKTANSNPYFFVPFLKTFRGKGWVEEEMVHTYLSTLFENGNEFLFREIRNNQNFSEHYRYRLPVENEILTFLFKDISFTENYSAWRPIGEETLNILEANRGKKGRDFLNTSYDDSFHEEKTTLWKSHLYVGIWYFDIMLREGIYQDPEGHLFLYYYEYFTRSICNNIFIDPDNRINENAEFPTFYHYCLYSMIYNMRTWIVCIEHSKNLSLLKNIVDCLGNCLEEISKCRAIKDKFKIYIFSTPIRAFLDTYKDPIHAEIRKHLKLKLMNYSEWQEAHVDYYRFQVFAWNEFDKIPYQNEAKEPIYNEFKNEIIANAREKGRRD